MLCLVRRIPLISPSPLVWQLTPTCLCVRVAASRQRKSISGPRGEFSGPPSPGLWRRRELNLHPHLMLV